MSDLPAAQRQALESWAEQAIEAGWLSGNARQALSSATTAAPDNLFEQERRPLVAGLFGGTGVGKSTLLNRFAGEAIAHTSAERPTSRAITIYVHTSTSVDKLPAAFPMERMRTSLHHNEQYRDVLFIDMPDFDSVESANRLLVDLWLPHLDVVIYVVSPERYRDDQGWRLLLQHAREHAWLFVMNHWDRAEPEQLDDFRQQLGNAGLDNPRIFRTDSSAPIDPDTESGQANTQAAATQAEQRSSDDFDNLQATLTSLSEQSVITSLQEHGTVARLKALKSISDQWLEPLADDSALMSLSTKWKNRWQKGTEDVQQSLNWKMQIQAQQYAGHEGFWLSLFKRKTNVAAIPERGTPLLDESLLTRLDNTLEDFLNQQAQQQGLALAALKHAVAEPYAIARRDISGRIDDALGRALAQPGAKWHRALHKTLGVLCTLLPLAAMAWITWRVVGGFVQGANNPDAYLNTNFAINGAMLLGLSWLIPAFGYQKLRPSRQKAAIRGMNLGVNESLNHIESKVAAALDELGNGAAALRADYQQLWLSLPKAHPGDFPDQLKDLLANDSPLTVQRSLDVRANTQSSTDSAPVS